MAAIVCSVEIARAPGEVYSYVTDPARFGEWQAGVIDGLDVGDQRAHAAADLDHPRHRRPNPC